MREAHVGKQLPHGLLEELRAEFGWSQPEVSHRMRFAEVCGSKDNAINALMTFSSWHEIVQHLASGLTTATLGSLESKEAQDDAGEHVIDACRAGGRLIPEMMARGELLSTSGDREASILECEGSPCDRSPLVPYFERPSASAPLAQGLCDSHGIDILVDKSFAPEGP